LPIHDPSSENPCWVYFRNLGIELDARREVIAASENDCGANSIGNASEAEHVRILVGSVLGDMESGSILVGRAVDD